MAVAMLGFAATLPAAAQSARDESVKGRARTDFKPLGLHLGDLLQSFGGMNDALNAYIVSPKLESQLEFDDNLFNAVNEGRADKLYRLKPSLGISSDWVNHALSITLDGEIGRYFENKDENYEDASAAIKGSIDIDTQTNLTFGYTIKKTHELGGAPINPVTVDTTGPFGPEIAQTFDDAEGRTNVYNKTYELGFTLSTDPAMVKIDAAARRGNYIDKESIDNDGRDIWQLVVVPRFGYLAYDGTTIFLQPRYTTRIYDVGIDAEGNNPDSQDYELFAGVTYDLTGLTFAELGLGAIHSRFDDPKFKPATAFGFDGSLIYNVTELITLTARAQRINAATTEDQTKIIQTTSFTGSLDYEAMDNLILGAQVSFSQALFKADTPDIANGKALDEKEDATLTVNLSLEYLIGENFFAGFSYILVNRNSNRDGTDLTKKRMLFRAGVQL